MKKYLKSLNQKKKYMFCVPFNIFNDFTTLIKLSFNNCKPLYSLIIFLNGIKGLVIKNRLAQYNFLSFINVLKRIY